MLQKRKTAKTVLDRKYQTCVSPRRENKLGATSNHHRYVFNIPFCIKGLGIQALINANVASLCL